MRREATPVFDLIEEATHLLRRAPAHAWLSYYLGTVPFTAYLFFFWSDMSRSASAPQHVIGSSLVLALLYWWMKVWQSLFGAQMLDLVEGKTESVPMRKRDWLRLITSQAWIHATMPWVLTLAAMAMLPFGWAYAFYHNISVLAPHHFREGGRTKALISRALSQSHYQPMQNHSLLAMLTITAVLVYLNFGVAFYTAATLAKSFTGIENDFTRQPMLVMSTPVQMLFILGSYLVMGPLVKALYALRCFHGDARASGADLQVRLRSIISRNGSTVAALAALVFLLSPSSGKSEEKKPPPSGAARAEQLDRSIKNVLSGSDYQWKMPREIAQESTGDNAFSRAIHSFFSWIKENIEEIARIIDRIMRWFNGDGSRGGDSSTDSGGGGAFVAMLPSILISLLVVLLLLLGVMVYRNWKASKSNAVAAEAVDAAAEINLESENVVATQLPENEWLKLAREKIQAGEYRLALRALFLATLAHLGEKSLIAIARSKSNGDYLRELGWRARGRDELNNGFNSQVRAFDRAWYGWHEVTSEDMQDFERQHERITTHAA